MKDMKKAQCCGWLYSTENGYAIDECLKGIQRIPHKILKMHFSDFNPGKDHFTAEIKQKSLGNTLYPSLYVSDNEITYTDNNVKKTVPAGNYVVVCTGYMAKKNCEYLFAAEQSTILVDKEIFKAFDTIHKFTPYYSKPGEPGLLKRRLKKGEKIPVFFEKDEKGKVVAMGITRMFRYPFKNSLRDCVERISKDHFSEKVDMTEAIFGHISKESSLKGRIHIGNAFSSDPIDDSKCVTISGVLGQPHPSYYPLYLMQEGGKVTNYSSNNAKLAGRKRYRITQGGATLELSQGNDNKKVITSFKPIPAGQTFSCKIRVHNLRKVEIGALLSSLTFNDTPGTYHNLGLGKSYGFGAFTCRVTLSNEFKYSVAEYIQTFNEEISYFLQEANSRISNEDCLNQLVSIASATHSTEEMRQMDFKECSLYKEDRNYSVLTEKFKALAIPIDESEVFRRKRLEKALLYLSIYKQLPDEVAIDKLKKLRFEITGLDMEDIINDIQLEIDRINNAIQEQAKIELQRREERERQRIADNANKKLNAGFSFLLEKKVGSDDLKIFEIANGIGRITKFLRQYPDYLITESDKEALHEWLLKLPCPTKKREIKEYCSMDSKSWMSIFHWIGEEEAKAWFAEIISGK
jgi:CRISPR-associated protein (TIGR03986 family)